MVIIAAACAVVLAACSSSSNTGGTNSTSGVIKPVKSFSAPKDLISFASPQADGSAWILSGTSAAKTIQELNLNSGSLGQPIGVISSAVSIAETYNGMIALGIATPGSGAVELLSSNNPGNVLFTIAVSAPVVEVVPSVDGSEFYALESANNVASIQTISTASGKIEGQSIPVPSNAISIVPTPDNAAIYVLQGGGQITEVSASNGQILSTFTSGAGAKDITISTNALTLFVLKCPGGTCNVSVIDAYAHGTEQVLPAPLGTEQIQVSPDNSLLWDAVGNPAYGNLQAFSLSNV
jgi:hypothetical protein